MGARRRPKYSIAEGTGPFGALDNPALDLRQSATNTAGSPVPPRGQEERIKGRHPGCVPNDSARQLQRSRAHSRLLTTP